MAGWGSPPALPVSWSLRLLIARLKKALRRDLEAVESLGHGAANQVGQPERAADAVADASAGDIVPHVRSQIGRAHV